MFMLADIALSINELIICEQILPKPSRFLLPGIEYACYMTEEDYAACNGNNREQVEVTGTKKEGINDEP
jgi:hypothetical protein